jgi:hypothetical protein
LGIGCLLLFLGPVGVAAGIAIALDADVLAVTRWIAGAVVSLCGIASLIWSVRLLSDRRHDSGGLMSATALRLGGALLLAMSLFRWTAAVHDGRGRMIAIAQAAAFTTLAWAAFVAARRRSTGDVTGSERSVPPQS